MVENLTVYPIIGFVITYLSLEVAWHLAVCKHKSQTMAPCVFKQVKMLIA
jgi:hypothetical protein